MWHLSSTVFGTRNGTFWQTVAAATAAAARAAVIFVSVVIIIVGTWA